jgi:iron complex outermembrane recepter protein
MHRCKDAYARVGMRVVVLAALLLVQSVSLAAPVAAQQAAGTVTGRVTAGGGDARLEGVRVVVAGTELVAVTDGRGAFRIEGVPAGAHTLSAERAGWRSAQVAVQVPAGDVVATQIQLRVQVLVLPEMVVTASREERRRAETPATIHVIGRDQLERTRPTHPSEVLNAVPGVWVNVTAGEGHMAAIRQPKTTSPVYLYLENGVPTRATGFFNHNALYEVNVPQAERIEVVKGPATALYGSDAIGGMVNVLTRSAAESPPVRVDVEGGAFGFARLLAAAGVQGGRDGLLAELNVTRTDGWRDGTAYERQSGTLRWDRRMGAGSSLRSTVVFSRIAQGAAGSAAISREDWLHRPHVNYTPISYRDVAALRASAAYERVAGSTLLSITPFMRWNSMEMLPNWTLSYDPVVTESGHASAGLLLKLRHDLRALRVIGGLDLDYSPGSRREWRIQAVRDGAIFRDFTRGDLVYDYDVTYWSASPYAQLEAAPIRRLRVVAGLRFDAMGFDYSTALEPTQAGPHRRPEDTAVEYRHLSPKLGATYTIGSALNVFASYGHGFRAPSESQLFRQGRAHSSLDLRPVLADNLEVGANGRIGEHVAWELAAYRMLKTDDLIGFTREDGSSETVNAGETLHRGIEAGLALSLPFDFRMNASYTHARHTFEEWTTRAGVDFAGRVMDGAPDRMGSIGVTWLPAHAPDASAGIEVQHIGPYWMDAANTHRYDGHTVASVRAEAPVTPRVAVFARLTNALGARYAENAQYTVARGEEFAPGMPRAFYLGARYR